MRWNGQDLLQYVIQTVSYDDGNFYLKVEINLNPLFLSSLCDYERLYHLKLLKMIHVRSNLLRYF